VNRIQSVALDTETDASAYRRVPRRRGWAGHASGMQSLGTVLLTLCIASEAWSQASPPAPAAPPVAGTAVLGVAITESIAVAVGYRASKLIGATVYNDKNEKIGKVGDLIVKPDGTLSYAIVDVGGFLGVGQHQVAIPVGQFSAIQPKLILPGATKDALKALPEFHYKG
jgi:sporulation protein YlmC with PRC-barrel domain